MKYPPGDQNKRAMFRVSERKKAQFPFECVFYYVVAPRWYLLGGARGRPRKEKKLKNHHKHAA